MDQHHRIVCTLSYISSNVIPFLVFCVKPSIEKASDKNINISKNVNFLVDHHTLRLSSTLIHLMSQD
jgi:hypothetical protein